MHPITARSFPTVLCGRLADVFEAAAKRQGADADKQARSRSKALKGPSLVGFVFSPDTECGISLDEQFLTAGAALDQFMLALSALGFGGIVLSGSVLADDGVQAFFCRKPGEKLIAWVICGTPTPEAKPQDAETREAPFTVWTPTAS